MGHKRHPGVLAVCPLSFPKADCGLCCAGLYVRLDVKGPPFAQLPSSARLTEEGWKSVTKRAATKHKPR